MATRVENLTEVAPGVFELRLPIPWEDEFVNVFLLAGGGHVDLIDCGMNSAASIDTIRRAVRSVGGEGARVRRLLITHIHPDHYGLAGLQINVAVRTGDESQDAAVDDAKLIPIVDMGDR